MSALARVVGQVRSVHWRGLVSRSGGFVGRDGWWFIQDTQAVARGIREGTEDRAKSDVAKAMWCWRAWQDGRVVGN